MIWALAILGITNIITLAVFAAYIYLESKEKAKTINALIAKDSQEYLNHEMADKIEQVKTEPPIEIPPEYTEISSLSDDEFDEKVVKSRENF